jgi:hypothetical protein
LCHKNFLRNTGREQGMFLIECVVYMALLFVVLELAYAAYYRCEESSKHLGQNVDDVVRALQAGERWRDDIRAATAITSSGDSLQLVQTNGTIDYVVKGNTVWRRAKTGGPLTQFLPRVKRSIMENDVRQEVTAWCWKLELLSPRSSAHFRPFFTFEAVPSHAQSK